LGWNLEDFDEVCPEYKRKPKENPVDCTLFIIRSPQLLIEAKDFGNDPLIVDKYYPLVVSYSLKRREKRWPKGGDDERINSEMRPVPIQSVSYMVKPKGAISFPMEHTRQSRELLLVDSFVNSVASLFAVEQGAFSMTSDLQRRRF
jgi:hypothetical protein